jgi:hypothetical protein
MKHHSQHHEPTAEQIKADAAWAAMTTEFKVTAGPHAIGKVEAAVKAADGQIRPKEHFDAVRVVTDQDGQEKKLFVGLGNAGGNVFIVRVPADKDPAKVSAAIDQAGGQSWYGVPNAVAA